MKNSFIDKKNRELEKKKTHLVVNIFIPLGGWIDTTTTKQGFQQVRWLQGPTLTKVWMKVGRCFATEF
jgi:hypothetical protein